jgi:hypothetical protein
MKILCVAAGATLFACNLVGFAQTEVACGQTLDVPLRSRAVLTIDSRPAGLEVVGTDREMMHVSCTSDDGDAAPLIRLHFSGSPTDAQLRITSTSAKHANLQVRIEVPRKISLGVKMGAGEVKVEEVTGDKDIDIYAGQISISSTQAWNYRSVDASVVIGAVNAPAYGANKGGFFRSVKREAKDGEYRLHAHVMTGEIDLNGKSSHATTD